MIGFMLARSALTVAMRDRISCSAFWTFGSVPKLWSRSSFSLRVSSLRSELSDAYCGFAKTCFVLPTVRSAGALS